MKKNIIILSTAVLLVVLAIHVGLQIFSLPEVELSLSNQTLQDFEDWYGHEEHTYISEMPSLGGTGRERLICINTSKRYDIILHRYEIGRYSFDQMVNYLLTEIFPKTIHPIGNRGLMSANVSFDSIYDILVVPSENMSIVFLARAMEDGYDIYPLRVVNDRIIGLQATEDGYIDFFFTTHTESGLWENLLVRRS